MLYKSTFKLWIHLGLADKIPDNIPDNLEDTLGAKRKGRWIWIRISGTWEEFKTWDSQVRAWMSQGSVDFAEWQVEEDQKYGLHIQGLMKFAKQSSCSAITAIFNSYAKFDWGNLLTRQDITMMKVYCKREKTRVKHGNTYGEDEIVQQYGNKTSKANKEMMTMKLVDEIREKGKLLARTSWFAQRGSKNTWDAAQKQYHAEEWASQQHQLYQDAKTIVWKPWQQFVVDQLNEPIDSRKILVILDEAGNSGKTFLMTKWKLLNEDRVSNLTNGKGRDLMHILSKKPLCNTILVNLPRSSDGPVNYQALEHAKDGEFTSTKYDGDEKSLNPTRMVIFTNKPLNWNALSKDRWQILTIQGQQNDYKVESYEEYKNNGGKDDKS